MPDLNANVGKLLLTLDIFGGGCSPAIRAVLPSDTDPEKVTAAISADMTAALKRHLPGWDHARGSLRVLLHPATGSSKRAKNASAAVNNQELFKKTPEEQADDEAYQRERERQIDEHLTAS
jgi:hypothetical protein